MSRAEERARSSRRNLALGLSDVSGGQSSGRSRKIDERERCGGETLSHEALLRCRLHHEYLIENPRILNGFPCYLAVHERDRTNRKTKMRALKLFRLSPLFQSPQSACRSCDTLARNNEYEPKENCRSGSNF